MHWEEKKLKVIQIAGVDGPQLYAPVELSSDRLELVDVVHAGRNSVRLVFLLKDVLRTFDLSIDAVVNGTVGTQVNIRGKRKPRSRAR